MPGAGPPGENPTIPERLGRRWPDFTIGGFLFRHARALTPVRRGRMKQKLANAHGTWMPEVRCNVGGERDGDINTIRRLAGSGSAAAVAEFLVRDADRVPVQEMLGDIFPIRFAVLEGGNLVGAFEWYAISEIRTIPGERHVRMMPYPAFGKMFPGVPGEMNLAVDVIEHFLSHPGLDIEGELLLTKRVRVFTFVDSDRNSRGDRLCAAFAAEMDARAADPDGIIDVAVTSNAWGRERRIVTLRA